MGFRSNFSFRQGDHLKSVESAQSSDPRLVIVVKDKKFRKAIAKTVRKLGVPSVFLDQISDYRHDALIPVEAIILDYSACEANNIDAAVKKLSAFAPEIPITITGPSKYAYQLLPPKAAGYVPRSLGTSAAIHLAMSAMFLEETARPDQDTDLDEKVSYYDSNLDFDGSWQGYN